MGTMEPTTISFLFVLPILFFCLIQFISYLWLVIVAFKQKILWGFSVLLLPLLAGPFIAGFHWSEAKRPFLTFFGTGLIAITWSWLTIFNMTGSEGILTQYKLQTREISKHDATEKLTELAIKKLIPQKADSKNLNPTEKLNPGFLGEEQEIKNQTDTFDEVKKIYLKETKKTKTVLLKNISNFVGKTIQVRGKEGLVVDGQLIRIHDQSLVLQKTTRNGTLEFEMRPDEIKSLQVYQ